MSVKKFSNIKEFTDFLKANSSSLKPGTAFKIVGGKIIVPEAEKAKKEDE